MAGGLINLTSYGAQDIFLTGNPQITFFKTIYRRYTNFAIESIEQQFQGKTDFGQTINLTLLKNGDLVNRMYLKVVLPAIDLIKSNVDTGALLNTTTTNVNDITTLNSAFKNYMAIVMSIVRTMSLALTTMNRTYTNIINLIITQYFLPLIQDNIQQSVTIAIIEQNSIPPLQVIGYGGMSLYTYYLTKLNQTATYMANRIASLYDFLNNTNPASLPLNYATLIGLTDIQTILSYITNSNNTDTVKASLASTALKSIIYNLNIMNNTILSDKYSKTQLLISLQNNTYVERYQFAWVKQLGHAIINNVLLEIGGQKIDNQTGVYMAIWHELTYKTEQEKEYNQMIGNIKTLYTLDANAKPTYTLMIPLQFWFCRNYGMSLPLINLSFHDVKLTVNLRAVEECCYTTTSDISFFNMVKIYGIKLTDVTLYTDYIYLDDAERRMFAQSSHEYLIEQVQYNDFQNVETSNYVANITFNHPTKALIWTVQKNLNLINPQGINPCLWTDFSYNGANTISSARLDFNSYTRVGPFDGTYFNLIQPYQSFQTIPSNGINTYCFALQPAEHQPSGSANFSKIDSAKLNLTFNSNLYQSLQTDVVQFDTQAGLLINMYGINYNILRFIGGMAGLAFSVV